MKLKSTRLIGVLLLLSLVFCLFSATAFAAQTDYVDVYANNTYLTTYTRSQLESNFTNYLNNYSTVDCSNPPVYAVYTAKGPELEDVFVDALTYSEDYDLGDVDSIKIEASDYDVTLTKSYLLDTTRYYYLEDANDEYDYEYAVPAILATKYANGADVSEGSLATSKTLRNFFGQTALNDYTKNTLVQHVFKITLNCS